MCISLWKFQKIKERLLLQKHSCETHIDHALDMLVAETGNFPIMEMLNEDEKLSTKCSYCEEQATYIVSSN